MFPTDRWKTIFWDYKTDFSFFGGLKRGQGTVAELIKTDNNPQIHCYSISYLTLGRIEDTDMKWFESFLHDRSFSMHFYECSSFLGSSYSWGPSGVYFRTLKLLSLCTCCLFFKDKTVTESLCLVKLSFVMSFKDQGKNSRILNRKSSDVSCRYCKVASVRVG